MINKIIRWHKWTTKKGEGGRILKGIEVKGNKIIEKYLELPSRDAKHITFYLLGLTFTIDLIWKREPYEIAQHKYYKNWKKEGVLLPFLKNK